jgi:6-phosphogluconolactonase (cycloisomerase 2 family)
MAMLALIAFGLLVACSTKYSSSNNGLVVLSTQGDAVMETFSIDLTNGHLSQINNVNGPPTSGYGTSVVLDPAGAFAYVLVAQNSTVSDSATGVQVFPVASDGKLGSGTMTSLNPVGGSPAVPVAMALDSAGNFLFIADASTSSVSGAVSVLAVSDGSLTEVPGSPFALVTPAGGQIPSPSALAVTPTAFPPAYAACSGDIAPTTEYLYVTDNLNYVVDSASVSSTGALTWSVAQAPTGTLPSGVTVDPCNRFVYVSNSYTNNVSAYTICSVVSYPQCPNADYSLLPVAGSPFPSGLTPAALSMDAYANFLYVLDTRQNAISAYRVSTTTGALTPLSPATVATNAGGTGGYAASTSIAIRNDDSWMFVTNFNAATISQYAITPATGSLTPQASSIPTFNYPWGVAVK